MWRHHTAWAPPEVTRDKRGIADLSASTHSPTADSRDVFMLTGALRMRQTLLGRLCGRDRMIMGSFGRHAVETAHDHESALPEARGVGWVGVE